MSVERLPEPPLHRQEHAPQWFRSNPAYVNRIQRLLWARTAIQRLSQIVERMVLEFPDALGSMHDPRPAMAYQREREVDERIQIIVRDVQELLVLAHEARQEKKRAG
jgi:hypothetical protein